MNTNSKMLKIRGFKVTASGMLMGYFIDEESANKAAEDTNGEVKPCSEDIVVWGSYHQWKAYNPQHDARNRLDKLNLSLFDKEQLVKELQADISNGH